MTEVTGLRRQGNYESKKPSLRLSNGGFFDHLVNVHGTQEADIGTQSGWLRDKRFFHSLLFFRSSVGSIPSVPICHGEWPDIGQ